MKKINFEEQFNIVKKQLKENKKSIKINNKKEKRLIYKRDVFHLYNKVKDTLDNGEISFSLDDEYKNVIFKFFPNAKIDFYDSISTFYYEIKITKRGLKKLLKEVKKLKE